MDQPAYIEADEAFRFELDKFLCGIATASNAAPLGRALIELCRTAERRGYETGYLDRETIIPAEVHGLRYQRMADRADENETGQPGRGNAHAFGGI